MRSNQLKIYNSLSGQKELFTPIEKGKVGLYVCGPTVYSNVHLGNLRTFLSFDVVFRYLKHLGYKVRYVRNITDVGHLTDDFDEEDKIAKRAKLEQIEPMEVVMKYTYDFHTINRRFNLQPPSIEPTATSHIIEQVAFIKTLLAKKVAYEANGSVYFDVVEYNKKENYGVLSNRNLDELLTNTRELDGQQEKKNPADFALWKKASPQHIMRWESPWSDGFPGWHLECTVMSTKYLGDSFDIHGGGMDLKFPHHECEIAQSKACFEKDPVNYWMHANMLTLNGQKMSKSTGNTILPEELFSGENGFFEKPINQMTLRFFMLQANYRSTLDLSNEAILAAEKGYRRLLLSFGQLNDLESSAKESNWSVLDWVSDCYKAMDDDFNTPILIANLFEAVKVISKLKEEKLVLTKEDIKLFKQKLEEFIFDVLGLLNTEKKGNNNDNRVEGLVNMLIEFRNKAREERDWAMSDKIRDGLISLGVELNDGREGTEFKLKD